MSLFPGPSAKSPQVKHSAESILYGVNFTPLLLAGELLTGAPTVTPDQTVGNLTLASIAINTATFTDDDGNTVAISQGVQVRVAGGLSPTDYALTVTCGTNQGNTRTVVCPLRVRDT